jgi:hypothetical protein
MIINNVIREGMFVDNVSSVVDKMHVEIGG